MIGQTCLWAGRNIAQCGQLAHLGKVTAEQLKRSPGIVVQAGNGRFRQGQQFGVQGRPGITPARMLLAEGLGMPHIAADQQQRIDPAERAAARKDWNSPVLWPLGVALLVLSLAIVPAWVGYRRRERRAALK